MPLNCTIVFIHPIKRPANETELKAKLTTVLKNTIALDKGIDATVLMTNHLYNVAADLSTAGTMIKGIKPEDKAKKAELKSNLTKKWTSALPIATALLPGMKRNPALKPAKKMCTKM